MWNKSVFGYTREFLWVMWFRYIGFNLSVFSVSTRGDTRKIKACTQIGPVDTLRGFINEPGHYTAFIVQDGVCRYYDSMGDHDCRQELLDYLDSLGGSHITLENAGTMRRELRRGRWVYVSDQSRVKVSRACGWFALRFLQGIEDLDDNSVLDYVSGYIFAERIINFITSIVHTPFRIFAWCTWKIRSFVSIEPTWLPAYMYSIYHGYYRVHCDNDVIEALLCWDTLIGVEARDCILRVLSY
jgi:hypothetical protein